MRVARHPNVPGATGADDFRRALNEQRGGTGEPGGSNGCSTGDDAIALLACAAEEIGRGGCDTDLPSGGSDARLQRLGIALSRLQERLANLEKLVDFTGRIRFGQRLDEVLAHVFESFHTLIPCDRIDCTLVAGDDPFPRSFLWDPTGDPPLRVLPGDSSLLGSSSLEDLLESNRPRIVDDLEALAKEHRESESTRRMVDDWIGSGLICPLTALDRPVGLLLFRSAKSPYDATHVETCDRVARLVSLVVENARSHEQNRIRIHDLEAGKDVAQSICGRYLSEDVVRRLVDTPGGLELGGQERKVTLLMADLRRFSALVAVLRPQQSIALLNRYLESMTRVIMDHHGTISEFIGDCIFAIFGAPESARDDARRAARCAISMQIAMEDVNRSFEPLGLPILTMGIGLHTGTVVAGNIGCLERAKYGVVGSAANITCRLEGCAGDGQVLVSETTLRELGADAEVRAHRQLMVKGFDGPIEASDLIGFKGGPRLPGPESRERLISLRPGFPVRYRRIVENQVGRTLPGIIARISRQEAEIRPVQDDHCPRCRAELPATTGPLILAIHDEVELLLNGTEEPGPCASICASVAGVTQGAAPVFRAVFTSTPVTGRSIIDELVHRGEREEPACSGIPKLP